MRAIDADEVLRELERQRKEELRNKRYQVVYAYNVAIDVVKQAKSLNVFKHGDWLQEDDGMVRCPECNWMMKEKGIMSTEQCPHCGCLMDGGIEDGFS